MPCKNDDEVIYAGDTGYVRFNLKTGIKAALADPEALMRGKNRFNDGKNATPQAASQAQSV